MKNNSFSRQIPLRWVHWAVWQTPALLILSITLLLQAIACAPSRYDITPDKTRRYHTLTLNTQLKNLNTGKSQSIKALLKYDDQQDKMLFLSPLNQVYGQLIIRGEDALLANPRNKRFWTGPFRILIREIWGLDYTYREFKNLAVDGVIPAKTREEATSGAPSSNSGEGDQSALSASDAALPRLSPPTIETEMDEQTGKPRRILIQRDHLMIRIKISERKSDYGVVDFNVNLDQLKKSWLREVLESNDE